MIRQYLSNKNESATVAKSEFFSQLRPCLVSKKFCKIFQIPRHIESLDACIEY